MADASSLSDFVLVVDDEPMVAEMATEALLHAGYRALFALDAYSGMGQLERNTEIDLLFTDVVMPGGMTGRQLADKVSRRQPGTKVLYTSGYTENAIVHHGRVDQDVMLLSKPYRKSELAGMVRLALGDIHAGLLESQPIPLADTSIGAPTRRQRANAQALSSG
jgi:CheY-like chemotaxis protein